MTAPTQAIPIPSSVEQIVLNYVMPRARKGEILITLNEFAGLQARVQEELVRLGLPRGISGLDAENLTHLLLTVPRLNLSGYTYDPEIGYVLT